MLDARVRQGTLVDAKVLQGAVMDARVLEGTALIVAQDVTPGLDCSSSAVGGV